jgi:hypothetical protein
VVVFRKFGHQCGGFMLFTRPGQTRKLESVTDNLTQIHAFEVGSLSPREALRR